MKYLTPEQVLAIHAQLIERFGGSHGLRDLGLLESAVARPQASFGGEDLYPDLFQKSAVLLHSLLKNHAFIDGNKRTAVTAAGILLAMNGKKLINQHQKTVAFALEVENGDFSIEEITAWLKLHSK